MTLNAYTLLLEFMDQIENMSDPADQLKAIRIYAERMAEPLEPTFADIQFAAEAA